MKETSNETGRYALVSTGGSPLRLRASPGNGIVIGTMNDGDIVYSENNFVRTTETQTINGMTDHWYLVHHPQLGEGWCFGGYLKIVRRDVTGSIYFENRPYKDDFITHCNTSITADDIATASDKLLWMLTEFGIIKPDQMIPLADGTSVAPITLAMERTTDVFAHVLFEKGAVVDSELLTKAGANPNPAFLELCKRVDGQTDRFYAFGVYLDPSLFTFSEKAEYNQSGKAIYRLYEDGSESWIEYDDRGWLVSQTYSSGNVYTYEYKDSSSYQNGYDQTTFLSKPDGSKEELSEKTTYDSNHRITSTWGSGSGYIPYIYDDRGNLIERGSETWTYNEDNQVTSHTQKYWDKTKDVTTYIYKDGLLYQEILTGKHHGTKTYYYNDKRQLIQEGNSIRYDYNENGDVVAQWYPYYYEESITYYVYEYYENGAIKSKSTYSYTVPGRWEE